MQNLASGDSQSVGLTQSKQRVTELMIAIDDLPGTLKYLYPTIEISSSNDAFVILLHAFMLEVGFIPKDVPEIEKLKLVPKNWSGKGMYSIVYYHPTCPEICCSMTCFPLYEQLSVFGTITDADAHTFHEPPNICLQVNHYVNKDSIGSTDPSKTFSSIKELSQIFKDNFAYPVLAAIQDALGFGPTFGLSAVMDEVKMQILSYLPVGSLVAMSSVNKEFYEMCNSSSLWKKLCQKDFPGVADKCKEANQDWKKLYQKKYAEKRQLQQYQCRELSIPLRNFCEGMEERHRELFLPPAFGPDFLIGIRDRRIPFPELQPEARPHNIIRSPHIPHNPLLNFPHIFQL